MSNLRVANYYESRISRNDGNPLYMYRAFGKLSGVESGHFAPTGKYDGFGKWDLHFEADWGEDALQAGGLIPYDLKDIPHPNAYWASDTHLGFEYRLNKARQFDHVFCAQKRAVEEFAKEGVQSIWLPHAVHTEAYFPQPSIKKYDVCFVGHINSANRTEALEVLFREFPEFYYGQRLFEEAAEKFCQSKIVFNISIKDDLNMRVFEALGTQSFLLTNDIPTIHEVFKDGVHLVTYKDEKDMIEKAKYYVEHEEEREKIAEAGYLEVKEKHTHVHRAKTVLDTCFPGWNSEKIKEERHAEA